MKIKDVLIVTPDVFTDYRGDLWTIWNKSKNRFNFEFNHDKISTSRKNVLRGIHGDFKSWKLVTCLYGSLYFVVVDNRPHSATYKQWDWLILDDKSRKQVLLPPGVGNGFYVLSDDSVFHYKWSYPGDYPDVQDQFTIKWNNLEIAIDWPSKDPILQLRDK